MIQHSSLKVWPVNVQYLIERDALQSGKTRSQLFKIVQSFNELEGKPSHTLIHRQLAARRLPHTL